MSVSGEIIGSVFGVDVSREIISAVFSVNVSGEVISSVFSVDISREIIGTISDFLLNIRWVLMVVVMSTSGWSHKGNKDGIFHF